MTSNKKPQAKRQLFNDNKNIQNTMLNTVQKNGSIIINMQQNLVKDEIGPLESPPHGLNHKRITAIASEKQPKQLWSRNKTHNDQSLTENKQVMYNQIRQIDSAGGIIPDLQGNLPPVPQFSFASPEIGHLAPLNNRQRGGNLIDQGNQKRLVKLQSLSGQGGAPMGSAAKRKLN